MKYYCPWCRLELKSNEAGATHKDPNHAWNFSECEYQVGDFLSNHKDNYPISELDLEESKLKTLRKQLENIPKLRKKIKSDIEDSELKIDAFKKEISPQQITPK